MSIEEQFNAAVKVIRSLPKNGSFQPSPELKLTFYAYFKQATDGPNETKKPPFYDVVNRYKWEAWKKLGETPKQEAMTFYVEELKKVIETLSLNEEVSDFLDILGPFYEFLPEEVTSKSGPNKASPGKLAPGLQETMDDQVQTNGLTCFNTYDSDGDEFSDTMDCTMPQSDTIPVILQNGHIANHFVRGESTSTHPNCRPGDGRAALDTKDISGSGPKLSGDSSGPALSSNVCKYNLAVSTSGDTLGFNEQLTMAVFRLQHSLDQVVTRIDTLESVLSRPPKRGDQERSAPASGLSKWLFPELSGRTSAIVIAWPLIVFFLINYVKQIRKK